MFSLLYEPFKRALDKKNTQNNTTDKLDKLESKLKSIKNELSDEYIINTIKASPSIQELLNDIYDIYNCIMSDTE